MKKEKLRACVITVPLEIATDTTKKLATASEVLDRALHFRQHIVVFPAGLLPAVSDDDPLSASASALLAVARAHRIGIVFGVEGPKLGRLVAWAPGMRRPDTWSVHDPRPRFLRVGAFDLAVVSEAQVRDPKLRRAVAANRPELVVICAQSDLMRKWRLLESFQGLGVPVSPSSYTLKKYDIPPLVCPRGYRMPDITFRHLDFSFSSFSINELDGAIDDAELPL